jgi:hypothetical protein
MARIQWARASQFNWTFDNLGGIPLQQAVAGVWDDAWSTVGADGCLSINSPNPGGGQVCYVRGVWLSGTEFPWAGFWAEPMSGELTNYYEGGSFTNLETSTVINLGIPLPPGTPVQLFYLYLTGERAARYEALNNYPCIRRASRARDDYTYDFAVDRILDLMAQLYFAGRERGRDYRPLLRFLWDAFRLREESCTSPLMQDSFERQCWDRGAYLMYRGATGGVESFQTFASELAAGVPGRVLHVRASLPATTDAAWFGYGLDWSLAASPFDSVDRLSLKLQGLAETRRLHDLTKSGAGHATLVLQGDYANREKRRYQVQVESTGAVGTARFKWSRDGGLTWEAAGLTSGDRQHPLTLGDGLSVYWESGGAIDLVAGDYWTFWAGEPAIHPRRLLVTLNDSEAADPDPWGVQHTFVHALPDRFPELTALELPFSQFWRRDNLIDDGDRVQAMWGAWYSTSQEDASDITIGTREQTEFLEGDTFYTQRLISWDLSPYATAFGVWAGIDTGRCDSSTHSNVNFLLQPVVAGAGPLTVRVKVKDARGSYFYQDQTVAANAWQRVTVNLAELRLESGAAPLTHPLQVVDVGIPAAPPSNGAFYLTDLKFDEHLIFPRGGRLRLLEFKIEQQGLDEHEWWLDDVSLNLEAADPYPYAPRLAISLTPYGQNPWRGPTLVHYAHPLAPYLGGALDLAQTYVRLHREAQEEFHSRYDGLPGPVMPGHTRNDVENIALCGEEDFNRFTWWRRHRDYGKVAGFWHFNGALTDASGHGLTLAYQGAGEPDFVPGICQPGATAVDLDGSQFLSQDGSGLNLGTADFTIELVVQPEELAAGARLVSKLAPGEPGYELILGAGGQVQATLAAAGGGVTLTPLPGLSLDTAGYHYLALAVDRDGDFTFCLDGNLGSGRAACPGSLDNSRNFTLGRAAAAAAGFFRGRFDLVRVHRGRALAAAELQDNWKIIQGRLNGSAYPEVGGALAQFWAFQRLAEYYFATSDPAAWEVLEPWLIWLDAYGAADGPGWQFPANFSEFGFTYGGYDPGAAAAVALGCLYIYLRNGHELAATWARRILDDLRLNRWDQVFGGYRSDCHYAWMNALVLRAFGLAAHGAAGQAYRFPGLDEDRQHFEAMTAWVFDHAGDSKPNVLNADLIPFAYTEDQDLWAYAPDYLAASGLGTLEAVVSMLGAAAEHGKAQGDWDWWESLLRFMVTDNLGVLASSQLRSLTTAYEPAGPKNLVRVFYADYDQDNGKYAEARDLTAIANWGEQAQDLDCRYGEPVVLEDPQTAQLLAARLLARLASPWETADVETWLEGLRLELGDAVALTSDFHGLDQAEFTVWGKELDLGRRTVRLNLSRPLVKSRSWAVDGEGNVHDAWALDQDSDLDAESNFRAYAG